jgi:hypothetical protein
VKYRALPQLKGAARQRMDRAIAAALLFLMVCINLLFWGPLPVAWLWVGSQVDYQTGSTFLGIVVAFFGLLLSLLVGLVVMRQVDLLWILARRASGVDQREGTIARVFAVSAIIGGTLFFLWLILIEGPGSSLGPAQST